jgi:adenine-specific DNA-methyltransferase
MDEVFGPSNFVSQISYATTGGFETGALSRLGDYILWYAKDNDKIKYNQLFIEKNESTLKSGDYRYLRTVNGERRLITSGEKDGSSALPEGGTVFRFDNVTSQDSPKEPQPFNFEGKVYTPRNGRHWTVQWPDGMERLAKTERLQAREGSLACLRFINDYPVFELTNMWGDTSVAGTKDGKVYVVQTNPKVVERCLLMTTDPGDLVLDPTCGSGTTAYVAEQWGRRWITMDSSRVALAIARQRLMTAKFDYYPLRDPDKGVSGGFHYKTVPHITLKSIAQNVALDPIFARWEPILANKLRLLNDALATVTPELRTQLTVKVELKRKRKDKTDPVTDADIRRWTLPEPGREWQEWEVPFDPDPDWTPSLRETLTSYRESWRAKMDEVNAAIAARAEQEELVDQPTVDRKKLRVAGPFTVEGVIPAEESLQLEESPIGGEPAEELETFDPETLAEAAAASSEVETATIEAASNAEAYLDKMIRLLRTDGVRFPDNIVKRFTEVRPLSGSTTIHAEGTWGGETEADEVRRIAVSFGPQFGPITSTQVTEVLNRAYKRGFDEIVFAGFSFDASAQAEIQANQDDPDATIQAHICHIRPDAGPSMTGLLKDSPRNAKPSQHNQIFTVSGLPRASVTRQSDGQHVATMEGVDIYDPVGNVVIPTGAEKVAAWFLDSDYDGKTFCITQAFFPDGKAWEKLSKALTGVVDPDRFAAFGGVTSLPFPSGKYKRAAIKVIDPRGNEVMRVLHLEGVNYAP